MINDRMLSLLPGDEKTYNSSDTIGVADVDTNFDESIYTEEFLNNINMSGIPNHSLKLKIRTPVMCMRNIDQKAELCNGTRLQVLRRGTNIIEAKIISGGNASTICEYHDKRGLAATQVLNNNDLDHFSNLHNTQKFADIMKKFEHGLIKKGSDIMSELSLLVEDDDPVIVQCNTLCADIDNEISMIHNFISEKYDMTPGRWGKWMTNRKVADVDADLESLEDKLSSGLADLRAELDKRHEQLVKLLTTSEAQNSPVKSILSVGFAPDADAFKQPTGVFKLATNKSGLRYDDLGFPYPDDRENPESSAHKNKGGKTVRFGEHGSSFVNNSNEIPEFDNDQEGTAREYVAMFEKLACQVVGVAQSVLEATFIKGLKPDLWAAVRVMKPESLAHAMDLAISIEDNQQFEEVIRTGVGTYRSNTLGFSGSNHNSGLMPTGSSVSTARTTNPSAVRSG
ncbi:hypothetical protein CTI12_AA101470 [Artemisia annua]|uniref:DNA helicase Pif1-like 2B domain-containing protein n=1 Tax=Artemisia annua TaxID=35608 RepID=A0A2U1PXC6_ARTAN|nr:hypothetical protein CTI12_AA101470 [Artemisia annua]